MSPVRPSLTPREREVIVAFVTAGGTKRAAAQLGISESTAKNHLTSVRRKLGVDTTTQAFVLAVRNRLIAWREITID